MPTAGKPIRQDRVWVWAQTLFCGFHLGPGKVLLKSYPAIKWAVRIRRVLTLGAWSGGGVQGGCLWRQQCQQNKDLIEGILSRKDSENIPSRQEGSEQKKENWLLKRRWDMRNAWRYLEGRRQFLTDGPVQSLTLIKWILRKYYLISHPCFVRLLPQDPQAHRLNPPYSVSSVLISNC